MTEKKIVPAITTGEKGFQIGKLSRLNVRHFKVIFIRHWLHSSGKIRFWLERKTDKMLGKYNSRKMLHGKIMC